MMCVFSSVVERRSPKPDVEGSSPSRRVKGEAKEQLSFKFIAPSLIIINLKLVSTGYTNKSKDSIICDKLLRIIQ